MNGRRLKEVATVVETLRRLVAHAVAVTGDRSAGTAIVREAVKRHPRKRNGIDRKTLAALLRDITDSCRAVPPGKDRDPREGYAGLPFEARACLSLRINFGLEFREIGRMLSMSGKESEALYSQSLRMLESRLRTGPNGDGKGPGPCRP